MVKIKSLMLVRIILVTLIMVAGPFVLSIEKTPFYTIFALFYLATLIYALLRKTRIPLHIQAYLQIVVDTILETAIIHYTGGVDSVYAFLYAPTIVASGVVISSRAAKVIAGTSSLFYGILSGLEYFAVVPPVYYIGSSYNIGLRAVVIIVAFRIIIFCLVGYLSSYLAYQLSSETTELLRLRNLSDIILRNISSGVLTLDVRSEVIYANPRAGEILGRDAEGIYWPSLMWKDPDPNSINWFIAQARKSSGTEMDVIRPDGKRLILSFSYADLLDERDRVIGGVLTFIDLTPLKEMELEIRQQEKLSAMGEMAVGIAHEIRNPLGSIRGALEVLKEKGRFQGEGEKLVDIIFKEGDRLNCIIEDFLKYARERRAPVKYEDMGNLVEEVWLLIGQDKRWHKGIELEKKLTPSSIILEIDPGQIRQVFYNLFINALEAMPRGGRIEVDIKGGEEKTTIIVKDNGAGMAEEEVSKIFQRFYSTKSYGLGMGLPITRRIIESHRGIIELHSEKGKGTTVTIVLPK